MNVMKIVVTLYHLGNSKRKKLIHHISIGVILEKFHSKAGWLQQIEFSYVVPTIKG